MHLAETPDQNAFRAEVRSYFADLLTSQIRAALDNDDTSSETRRALYRQMGSDGWLGVGWPKEYGGQGRSTADQFIFVDESKRADAPLPFVTLNTVGPTMMNHGSKDMKKRFLPGFISGEINFAIGYTEPTAGTDLASLRTRAVRDGDEFVINGQKIWTSNAHEADYIWLACRTDPDAKPHRGISILVVPTTSEGFSCTPLTTVGGMRSNTTYYDNIRVPIDNVVGEVNQGWTLITSQLNHERVGLSAIAVEAVEMYDQVLALVREHDEDGGRRIDTPWVQMDLARCKVKLDAMTLQNWQMVQRVDEETLEGHQASGVKVYGTEAAVEVYNLLIGLLGAAGRIRPGSPSALLAGRLERCARSGQINTFGGGVNEVQRDMVAWMRLGLQRPGRR